MSARNGQPLKRAPRDANACKQGAEQIGPSLFLPRFILLAKSGQLERFRQQLVSAAQAAGADVISPTPEVIAEIEKEYIVTVLVPPRKPKARPNETSLVIVGYDKAKGTAFLFTGDSPAGTLRQMLSKLPNHVNVLQAPHHGADPGLLDLVAKTNPDYIVISANKWNRYAHPRFSLLCSLAAIRPPPTRLRLTQRCGGAYTSCGGNRNASNTFGV